MKKLIILAILYVTLSLKFHAQDVIVLHNGEQIRGEIIYEQPLFYKIKDIQGEMRTQFGRSAKIYRRNIVNVIDQGDHALLKKFGKVKIWFKDEEKVINKPFYAANKTSVSYISSTYKSVSGRKQYNTEDIQVHEIDKIKWSLDKADKGALAGMVAGGVGAAIFLVVVLEEGDTEYVTVPVLIGLGLAAVAGGALIGSMVGSVIHESEKIPINGDQSLWEKGKSKLPSSGFRSSDE